MANCFVLTVDFRGIVRISHDFLKLMFVGHSIYLLYNISNTHSKYSCNQFYYVQYV